MKKIMKITGIKDTRVLFSTLWIFAVLNYLYADVMSLMNPQAMQELFATGQAGPLEITPGFLLGAAVLMETALAMVILSRVLACGINRWLNIIIGMLHTAAVFGSLFVGQPEPFYIFFAAIEMACTVLIVFLAIRWREYRNHAENGIQ
jgi:hypothetical protein